MKAQANDYLEALWLVWSVGVTLCGILTLTEKIQQTAAQTAAVTAIGARLEVVELAPLNDARLCVRPAPQPEAGRQMEAERVIDKSGRL